MNDIERERLTKKERFWYKHIEQVRDSNQSLSEYASAHNLDLKCFYNYRSKLRKKGFLESRAAKSFIKVKAQKREFGTLVVLPNGIRFQTQCSVAELSDLIKRLL